MTLPASGKIDMAAVRAEVGIGGAVSLGDDPVRSLAAVLAGEIALADLYGKTGSGGASTLAVVVTDGFAQGQATGAPFTAEAFPEVAVTGGTAPLSFLWTVATQSDSRFTLDFADQATCRVSHDIGRYGYIGGCTLTCVISDAAGHQATAEGVAANFEFQQEIPM